MNKIWSSLRFAPVIMVLLSSACNGSISSSKAAPLMPQVVTFEGHTINLLSIGQLTHKFSLGPPEHQTVSECYTHRSETMEQVLCWTKTEPDFEPNLASAFTGILNYDAGVNLLGPSVYIDSPRKVSGFQGIEFEAYLREADQPKSIRTLLWATSGNVWHVTFFFITGYPKGEATVEAVFNSVELEGEARPIKLYGNVPEQPGFLPRGVDRLLIRVTSKGEIYLNGQEASLDDVRQALRRLDEVDGIVLYDRAGGHAPPPEAESVSAEILFAIGMAGVEIFWLDTSQE